MQVATAPPTSPNRSLDSVITSRSVDEIIHLVLAPDESVGMFCFAQRLLNEREVCITTIVLAERHLLLIRPTPDGGYGLDLAEDLDRCSMTTSERRPDGSLLIAIRTPSGLLCLHIDASWKTQADLLESTLGSVTRPPTEFVVMTEDEHAPADGVSFDGDGFDMVQQLAALGTDIVDIDDDKPFDFWIN